MTKYFVLEPLRSFEIKFGKRKYNGGGISSVPFNLEPTGIPSNSYIAHRCSSLDEAKTKKEELEKKRKRERKQGKCEKPINPCLEILLLEDLTDRL